MFECAIYATSVSPLLVLIVRTSVFFSHSALELIEVRAWQLPYTLYLSLCILLKLALTYHILRYTVEECLYRALTQWPPTNSRLFLRINQRMRIACLKLTEASLPALQCHWAHPHLLPHSPAVYMSECMCMSEYEAECIFVAFPPLSLTLQW